ncbi:TIGR03826 family flagellar region protein [Massilibacterium senegalense]|uniref:TIGR03826 family flagellar region protein n=1 Tax=Massilibacterium senegalense TaxID=1632858 RepID=UPI000781F598|nr:TIGR03826 family flagellar region protein [Massilibacterium senegalense]
MSGQLDNCPRCGQLFLKGFREICPDCYKKEQENFDKVYRFVRKQENRRASMQDIIDGTGVSEDDISRFIREGRLRVSNMPNLGYKCESCEKTIKSGTICNDCKKQLAKELQTAEELAAIKERQRKEANRSVFYKVDGKK